MAVLDNDTDFSGSGGDFGPGVGAGITSSSFGDPAIFQPTQGAVLINGGRYASINNQIQPGQYALLQNDSPAGDASGIPLRLQGFVDAPPAKPVLIPSESHSADGGQEISCLWDAVWQTRKLWVDAVMGSSVIDGGNISRTIPQQCPEPGYWHLFAADCSLTSLVNENACWLQSIYTRFNIVLTQATNTSTLNTPGGTSTLSTRPTPEAEEEQGQVAGQLVNNPAAGEPVLSALIPWPMHCEGPPNIGPGIARYKVSYRKRPYMVRTDQETANLQAQYPGTPAEMLRYCERSSRQSLQAQPFAPGSLEFADARSLTFPENAAYVLVPTAALRYVLHEWPSVPYKAWDACQGLVNANPFDGAPGFPTYAPETLLMQAPQKELYQHTNGQWYWRIVYEFLYRPKTWNYMLAQDGVYHPVQYKKTKKKLFEPVDFNQLFVPEGAQPLM